MIEDITLIDIDSKTREKMISKLDGDILLNMACNYKLINGNIELFRELKINNIDDLILNRPYIFFMGTEYISDAFKNAEDENIIDLINSDYTEIDELL